MIKRRPSQRQIGVREQLCVSARVTREREREDEREKRNAKEKRVKGFGVGALSLRVRRGSSRDM